jgi:hypothetical protein
MAKGDVRIHGECQGLSGRTTRVFSEADWSRVRALSMPSH